jgi:hypothetical protein
LAKNVGDTEAMLKLKRHVDEAQFHSKNVIHSTFSTIKLLCANNCFQAAVGILASLQSREILPTQEMYIFMLHHTVMQSTREKCDAYLAGIHSL